MRTIRNTNVGLTWTFDMRCSFRNSTRGAVSRILLLTLSCFSHPALAFQPLIADDTGTQGSGGNQLEFSFNEDRAKVAGSTDRTRTLPVVYTRGPTDTLDVFAGLSHARIDWSTPGDDASGAGNPAFGAKWRFQ